MSAQAADALMSIFGFGRVTLRGDGESGTAEVHELEVVMTLTDELIAELEEECGLAAELDCNAAVTHEHLRALLSERAELKRDAERYRWLRDESLSCGVTAPAIMVVDEAGNPVYRGNPWNSLLCDDDADAAIDAAMTK